LVKNAFKYNSLPLNITRGRHGRDDVVGNSTGTNPIIRRFSRAASKMAGYLDGPPQEGETMALGDPALSRRTFFIIKTTQRFSPQ
jgi:hypothetical protein